MRLPFTIAKKVHNVTPRYFSYFSVSSLPRVEPDIPELGPDVVEHIKNCLKQGCRSIKIDCFDGPEGPLVSRSLQSLNHVLEAINESAFASSP